jgi:hypothetical protein
MKTILYLKGSEQSFKKLKALHETGELTNLLGYKILDIRESPKVSTLERFSWLRRFYQSLTAAFSAKPWEMGLATVGVLILVVSLILLLPKNPIDSPKNPIDSAYQTIYANNTMAAELREFQFIWETENESNSLAFSPNQKQPSLAAKAFGAGLLTGRETLLGKRDVVLPAPFLPPAPFERWLKTDWKNYFELGRWTFLLWTVSQMQPPLPPTFWDEQRQILAQLRAAFEQQTEVLFQLDKQIRPFLDKLPAESGIYDEFGFKLENLMDFLSTEI